jgi:hypothetical protein
MADAIAIKENSEYKEIITDKHWTVINTNTLLKWITIGSHYIKVLERTIAVNRAIIRSNTIISIMLTTATGSIGVSQISSIFSAQNQLVLTVIFTVMSFFLTISTGVIKVLLIHENLEKCIQVKQEWTSFITNISTELQLPRGERQDALKLIRDNKMIYLSLLNKDIEVNHLSEEKAKQHIQHEIDNSMQELKQDASNNIMRKDGHNDYIIDFGLSRKTALHNDYSKMMNSVGISISDITNHIVKTELQAILDIDLEAQYNQVVKKETQIAKAKFSCELQHKQKEMESKRNDKTSNSLMLLSPSESYSGGPYSRSIASRPLTANSPSSPYPSPSPSPSSPVNTDKNKEKEKEKETRNKPSEDDASSFSDANDPVDEHAFSWRKVLHL